MLQVGKATVERARRVEREAPELVEPIRRGEMTINAAVKKIKEKDPQEPRKDYLKDYPPEIVAWIETYKSWSAPLQRGAREVFFEAINGAV